MSAEEDVTDEYYHVLLSRVDNALEETKRERSRRAALREFEVRL